MNQNIVITDELLNEIVPKEYLPSRITSSTSLYIYVESQEEKGLLLYYVNPAWNQWYPLHIINTIFMQDEVEFPEGITYSELILAFEEKFQLSEQKYSIEQRKQELLEKFRTLYQIEDGEIGSELKPLYELKYSVSQGVYSMYKQEGVMLTNMKYPQVLFQPICYPMTMVSLECPIQVQDIPLVSNIKPMLQQGDNYQIITDAKINTLDVIDKVGAIILKDKKILVQRKKNGRAECIIPGGKRELGETDLETLCRELKEEMTVDVDVASFFGEYDDIACFSDKKIHVRAYLTTIIGEIQCANEIKEAIWIDRGYKEQGIQVGNILGEHIIPALIEQGLM